jgi:threonine aldolase
MATADSKPVDLRSDTVTQPSAAMRQAMAAAAVGDDVYGEDPSVRALEAQIAELANKEAALFVPSGTMANQLAIATHTSPGDEVLAATGSHCIWYESGAGAALWGVQFREVGRTGEMAPSELAGSVRERAYYAPNPKLVVLENTHNRGGGSVLSAAETAALAAVAREKGLSVHLDGARLWNAAIALGVPLSELTQETDTVSLCFSKGLGAPVGSILAGDRARLEKAHRLRKMLGGGMRQVGVLAAACQFALRENRARLAEDHENAAHFAERLHSAGLAVQRPRTNIVMVDVAQPAAELVKGLRERGILLSAFGPHRLRAVTHLDVQRADVERAAAALIQLVQP